MPQPPPRLYAESALLSRHWGDPGKATRCIDPQARRPAMQLETNPVGCDGKRSTT